MVQDEGAGQEGRRHTPSGAGCQLQFFFGTSDVSGTITVAEDLPVQPGDRAEVSCALTKPVGIESGIRFAIREGGRTVAAGFVTEVDA